MRTSGTSRKGARSRRATSASSGRGEVPGQGSGDLDRSLVVWKAAFTQCSQRIRVGDAPTLNHVGALVSGKHRRAAGFAGFGGLMGELHGSSDARKMVRAWPIEVQRVAN